MKDQNYENNDERCYTTLLITLSDERDDGSVQPTPKAEAQITAVLDKVSEEGHDPELIRDGPREWSLRASEEDATLFAIEIARYGNFKVVTT